MGHVLGGLCRGHNGLCRGRGEWVMQGWGRVHYVGVRGGVHHAGDGVGHVGWVGHVGVGWIM